MKLILLLTVIAVSNADKLRRGYLPPAHSQVSAGGEYLQAPIVVGEEAVVQNSPAEIITDHREDINGVVQIGGNHATYVTSERPQYQEQYVVRAERPQGDSERAAAVLRQEYENNGESYSYVYETQNGIFGEESGVATDGVKAHGGYSYVGDDGHQYTIRYTADENGFHPEGDHLPTPPPIPEEILKSIEQNARDEAAGIFDDGSYDERKYGEADHNQYVVSSNVVPQDNVVIVNDGHADAHEDTVVTNSVPVVTNTVPVVTNTVPVITNTVPVFPRPFYRPVGVHQNLNGVVVNKAYLPPHPQPIIEDRSSNVFGSRNRRPNFNTKSGYRY